MLTALSTLIFFRALLTLKLQPVEPRGIPAFSADGARRERLYSEAACLHLEQGGWAELKRSRRGVILAVLFRDAYGADAQRRTLQPGQRYSVLEPIAEGTAKIWVHALSAHRLTREQGS